MSRKAVSMVVLVGLVLGTASPALARPGGRSYPRQVAQLAALLDFSQAEVRDRLSKDEEFRMLAWKAASARTSRQRTGKGLVAGGVVAIVLGSVVGGLLLGAGKDALNNPEHDNWGCHGLSCDPDDAQATYDSGIGVMTAGLALGTALLIPGAVMLSRTSAPERRLIEYTRGPEAAAALQPDPAPAPGPSQALVVPPEPVPLDGE